MLWPPKVLYSAVLHTPIHTHTDAKPKWKSELHLQAHVVWETDFHTAPKTSLLTFVQPSFSLHMLFFFAQVLCLLCFCLGIITRENTAASCFGSAIPLVLCVHVFLLKVFLKSNIIICLPPLRGCRQPESCRTSRSAGRAGASSSRETTPSQLQTHTHKHRRSKKKNVRLRWIPAFLYLQTCTCLPKYTVLLHLGQMLGPPEKEEKLAAEGKKKKNPNSCVSSILPLTWLHFLPLWLNLI